MEKNKYEGTQTEQNLKDAFSGESEARNKYTYFASVAKYALYQLFDFHKFFNFYNLIRKIIADVSNQYGFHVKSVFVFIIEKFIFRQII